LGVKFDCAVFTNLHKEHIESHGSFENYYQAKQELFKRTSDIHVINADDLHTKLFGDFPAKRKIFYGLKAGDMRASVRQSADEAGPEGTSFEVYGTSFSTELVGRFNVLNCLAALSVGAMYGIDLPKMKPVLELIKFIPGRMEFIQRKPFSVVVDYAHTPESLELVYKTLKQNMEATPSHKASEGKTQMSKLICVLGAAGGGRDKWKRPEFGRIAAEYCDEIILTNEDSYDESPQSIIKDVEKGFSKLETKNPVKARGPLGFSGYKLETILDRREAIRTALTSAREGDTVVITGKGSEISMAVAGGKKIPWSDRDVVREYLNN
jgi:UDP-N-acetylmuramoyl-L-alanyl-D-glutamate--2,6-diaminopimelate ligase